MATPSKSLRKSSSREEFENQKQDMKKLQTPPSSPSIFAFTSSSGGSPSQKAISANRRAEAEKQIRKRQEQSEKKQRENSERKHQEVVELTEEWKALLKTDFEDWFSDSESSRRIHQMVLKGIPSSVRGKVWPLLIGNDLKITEETYQRLLTVAETTIQSHSASNNVTPLSERLTGERESIDTESYGSCRDSSYMEKVLGRDSPFNSDLGKNNSRERSQSVNRSTACEGDDEKDKGGGADNNIDVPIEEPIQSSSEKEADGAFFSLEDEENRLSARISEYTTRRLSDPPSTPPHTSSCMNQMDAGSTPARNHFPSRSHQLALIEHDLPRTFPTLGFFHDGGPLQHGLERVLQAYACFRPDVGYVQGMSYLVAMLLLNMDEVTAFKCLVNVVAQRGNLDFYRLKKEAIDNYVLCFDFFFDETLPLLYAHLREAGVTSEMYLIDWILALFAKALPLEVAARLWDCYLLEGEVFIIRAALGILRFYATNLAKMSLEGIMSLLVHVPDDINADELINAIAQIKLSNKRYMRVRERIYSEANRIRIEAPGTSSSSALMSSNRWSLRSLRNTLTSFFSGFEK